MTDDFPPFQRGGSGSPLVCLHGLTDTWRSWELVLERLERNHDVLAPTLAGHAGGPAPPTPLTSTSLVEAVERVMDEAGFDTAHVVGNSLGGFVALQLAERGRARSVVALAPAGGWPEGDPAAVETMRYFLDMQQLVKEAVPYADQIVSSRDGRRRATEYTAVSFEHIPGALLAHQIRGVAACVGLRALIEYSREEGWQLDPEQIECPVRVVWGTEDRLLPWPNAAQRFRDGWLPRAEWEVLEDVGHCPQLDVPAITSELILGFTR
jgi:pimeloyl-ACP methyl ester carboxylesterase